MVLIIAQVKPKLTVNTIVIALSETVRFLPFLTIHKLQGVFGDQESFTAFKNGEHLYPMKELFN